MTAGARATGRIVLAFSGGLKATVAMARLLENEDAEVVTVTMDLGHGRDLEGTRARALALGAVRARVLDLCEDFARECVLPTLRAGATESSGAPLAAAAGRPLIAARLVAIARLEGAAIVAHGCAGEDATAMRDLIAALDPALRVLAPAAEFGAGRAAMLDYARARRAPFADGPGMTDANLWGRSARRDDPAARGAAPRAIGGESPAVVEIAFEAGAPTSLNGVPFSLVDLIAALDTIAAAHGVGRFDSCEAPAATVLHRAHDELQRLVTPRDLGRLVAGLPADYAELIRHGGWYTPERDAMDTLVAEVQARVTGLVTVQLSQGACVVVGSRSPFIAEATAPRALSES